MYIHLPAANWIQENQVVTVRNKVAGTAIY